MATEDAVLPESVTRAIDAFADGRPVSSVDAMPGHAGFSYGVVVDGTPYVLRVPPPGTRHEGPADVLRQARLLELLEPTPVPVPAVRGSGPAGDPWFVVDRLPGTTIRPTDTSPPAFGPAQARRLAFASVDALRALHEVPAPEWLGPPRDPAEAVTRWDRFAERAADQTLLAHAPRLRDQLLASTPRTPATGIVHGDFQWGNLLASASDGEPRVLAVIDWELAHTGSVLDDLGWLCIFSDPGWWSGTAMSIPPGIPDGDELRRHYGAAEADLRWHTAAAAYGFAVVIALNLSLHRRGKRHDPLWEELAPSAPVMLSRALRSLA